MAGSKPRAKSAAGKTAAPSEDAAQATRKRSRKVAEDSEEEKAVPSPERTGALEAEREGDRNGKIQKCEIANSDATHGAVAGVLVRSNPQLESTGGLATPDLKQCGLINVAVGKGSLPELRAFRDVEKLNVAQAKDSNGGTPIHRACVMGKLPLVKVLLSEFGCDPNATDNNGRVPLHWACQRRFLPIVKFLVEACQCDCNVQGSCGMTPLHFAVMVGDSSIVQYLVESGRCTASYSLKDAAGLTPRQIALKFGYADLVEYLDQVERSKRT
jgi:hypothetical protein